MTDSTEPVLYHAANTRSFIVLWMLEEIGRPYELRVVDLAAGENRQPPFLAVNPMGKVPVLIHDGATITETGAICCYLAETFAAAGLAVPLGDGRRGSYLKWLFFNHSCMEPALMDRMLERPAAPRHMIGYGDFDTMLAVVADAVHPGPFLLGETFTTADVLIGSSLIWGRMIGVIPQQPEIMDYIGLLEARPAYGRTAAIDAGLVPAQPA